MFSKLKEALKKSIGIFSRKANEEAGQEPVKESSPKQEKSDNQQAKHNQLSKKDPVPKPQECKETDSPKAKASEADDDTYSPEKKGKDDHQEPSLFKRIFKSKMPLANTQGVSQNKKSEQSSGLSNQFSLKEPEIVSEANGKEAKPEKGFYTKAVEFITTKKLSDEKFEELFWDVELALLENNVAVDVVHKIKSDLKSKLIGKPLPRNLEAVIKQTLEESLRGIIQTTQQDWLTLIGQKRPYIVAFFGTNGSGKTTTLAKVAKMLQKDRLSCVMAAGDTFRAAAIQQLEEHARNLNIRIIKHDYGADAAAVAFDAVKFAQKNGIDVVLIDTAGRLHSDVNLMDELQKIVRITKPDMRIFVGESITGNDCIEQSKRFDEIIGIDHIILTKADVDEKGGTALSISYATKKPILYVGTGQGYEDLKPCTKELILNNLGLST